MGQQRFQTTLLQSSEPKFLKSQLCSSTDGPPIKKVRIWPTNHVTHAAREFNSHDPSNPRAILNPPTILSNPVRTFSGRIKGTRREYNPVQSLYNPTILTILYSTCLSPIKGGTPYDRTVTDFDTNANDRKGIDNITRGQKLSVQQLQPQLNTQSIPIQPNEIQWIRNKAKGCEGPETGQFNPDCNPNNPNAILNPPTILCNSVRTIG